MQQEFLEAVRGFNAVGRKIIERGNHVDDLVSDRGLIRQKCKTPENSKKQLEKSFLSPPTAFSSSWLDRLQQ